MSDASATEAATEARSGAPVPRMRPFSRDLPDAQIHLLDTGHFALETHLPEITELVRQFLREAIGDRR